MLKHQAVIYNYMLEHGHTEEFAIEFIENVSDNSLIEMAEFVDDGNDLNPTVFDTVKETLRIRKAYRSLVEEQIEKRGFVVMTVFDGEGNEDTFSYTEGFSDKGKAELYLSGSGEKYSSKDLTHLLTRIANEYRDKALPINEVLEVDDVTVNVNGTPQPLKYLLWKSAHLIDGLPKGEYLQVLFGDKNNVLPPIIKMPTLH